MTLTLLLLEPAYIRDIFDSNGEGVGMRVLHILRSSRLSGAENVVADICMMFKGEHEMAYCSPDGPIRHALADRGVKYLPLKKLNSGEIRQAVGSLKPDVIHAHDVRASVLAAYNSGGIPVISHIHGNNDDMRKLGLKPLLYLNAARKARKVVVVSESCLNDYIFKKQIIGKAVFLRNIVYTARINMLLDKDPGEYNFDFVYAGRLSHPKNPLRVARVAAGVLKLCPGATFGVIGSGELEKGMRAVFTREGVADRVTFTGMLPYPYKALKQAKCILMCSRYEGTPVVALEALTLGVPVIATPVDGLRGIIHNGINGYSSHDDVELCNYVVELIKNADLRRTLSHNSIKMAQTINNVRRYKVSLLDIYNI